MRGKVRTLPVLYLNQNVGSPHRLDQVYSVNQTKHPHTNQMQDWKRFLSYSTLAAAIVVIVGWQPVWAFEPNQALSDVARISLDQAVQTAVSVVPGKVVEAQLGKVEMRCSPNTVTVYQIVVLDLNERLRTIYVHADKGRTLRTD